MTFPLKAHVGEVSYFNGCVTPVCVSVSRRGGFRAVQNKTKTNKKKQLLRRSRHKGRQLGSKSEGIIGRGGEPASVHIDVFEDFPPARTCFFFGTFGPSRPLFRAGGGVFCE